MKNIKKMALIALLITVLIPSLLLVVNGQKTSHLDKVYKEPKGSIYDSDFILQELEIPGRRLVLQAAERTSDPTAKTVTQSYLNYSTLQKLIFLVSEQPAPNSENEPNLTNCYIPAYLTLTAN